MNRKTTSFSRFNLTLAEVGLRRPAYLQALLGIGVTEAVSDLAEAA
jgi:hypothetical protein